MRVLVVLGVVLMQTAYAQQVSTAPEISTTSPSIKPVVESRSFTTVFVQNDGDLEELERRWSFSIPSIRIPSISIPRFSIPSIAIPTFDIGATTTPSTNVLEAASKSYTNTRPYPTAQTAYRSSKSSSPLSRRAIIGISIAGAIVLANLAIAIWFIYTKIRNKRKARAAVNTTQPPLSSTGNVLVKRQRMSTPRLAMTLNSKPHMDTPSVALHPPRSDMVVQIDGRETHRHELATNANVSELGAK